MPAEKTEAIVLRVIEFSETSVVTTLYTRDFGKITALAKGARRPKSPFEAALDRLARCAVLFLHKTSGAMSLLTEAKLLHRFRAGQRSLPRLYAGYYAAELLLDLTDEGDPQPELFEKAWRTLDALDGDAPPATTILQFELAVLRLMGNLPELDHCVACGQEVLPASRAAIGLLASGLYCPQCRVGQRQVVTIAWETLRALRQLAAAEGDARDPRLTKSSFGEIRGLLNQYIAGLLGRKTRMSGHLNVLSP